MKKLITILSTLIIMSIPVMAENFQEIYLNNGVKIKGTIVEQIDGESLKIRLKDGRIILYPMSIIKKVTTNYNDEGQKEPNTNIILSKTNNIGYKGFFDYGYVFDLSDCDAGRMELTTTHGYQFNPYFFVGIGVGYNYYARLLEEYEHAFPIFANIRVTTSDSNISPYIDAKLGYSVSKKDVYGLYFSPSIGCRFGLNEKNGINIGFGYSLQQAEDVVVDIENIYNINIYTKKKVINGLNLKISIDF